MAPSSDAIPALIAHAFPTLNASQKDLKFAAKERKERKGELGKAASAYADSAMRPHPREPRGCWDAPERGHPGRRARVAFVGLDYF